MTDDVAPDDDTFAALDFSATDDGQQSVDALQTYAPSDDPEVDDASGPLFTVANPSGTVTVTTYLNGCVQHVSLSHSVTKLTETELSQEIMAVTAVAATKARAALHAFVAGLLRLQGMDSVSAADFVERRLALPTPEYAAATEAEFVSRYTDDSA